jgi:hypothetical protein
MVVRVPCVRASSTRVIHTCGGQRSVFCFIDGDGNIYKPASWKAPAKGIRGTLATVDMSKVDGHGSWLPLVVALSCHCTSYIYSVGWIQS